MNPLVFLSNELNSKLNSVKGETINQPSTSTGPQILMKSVCLQNYAPFFNMASVLLP